MYIYLYVYIYIYINIYIYIYIYIEYWFSLATCLLEINLEFIGGKKHYPQKSMRAVR